MHPILEKNSSAQTEVTAFAFSSVFILLLWELPWGKRGREQVGGWGVCERFSALILPNWLYSGQLADFALNFRTDRSSVLYKRKYKNKNHCRFKNYILQESRKTIAAINLHYCKRSVHHNILIFPLSIHTQYTIRLYKMMHKTLLKHYQTIFLTSDYSDNPQSQLEVLTPYLATMLHRTILFNPKTVPD